MLLLLLLVAGVTNTLAQDVTISPTTGSLMAALTQEGESGSAAGNSSTWKHNQLALTLTVADFCNITSGGEIANPAGNLNTNSAGELTICGGNAPDVYMAISLPKGFRFTGYEMVIANNINGRSANGRTRYAQQKIFYETSNLSYLARTTNMDYDNADDYRNFTSINTAIGSNNAHYLAVARSKSSNAYVMRGANEDNEADFYVITRTSMAADGSDMGNHLYFRLSHADNNGVGITLKSARFYFTAEGDFNEEVAPEAKPGSITTEGKNYMLAPFTTGKLDLGDVSLDENGHYTYNYMNVRDMTANNVIYESGAVTTAGALPETPGEGGIYGVYNGGNYYYGLKNNNTNEYYFVECPTTAPTSSGEDSHVGFRITGAKVNYTFGQEQRAGTYPVTKEYEGFYIHSSVSYRNDWGENETANLYLRSNGEATTNKDFAAVWFIDEEGHIRTGNNGGTYLTWTGTGTGTRTVSTINSSTSAKTFTIPGGYIAFNEGQSTFRLQGQYYRSGWDYVSNFRFNSNNSSNKATRMRSGTPVSISGGNVTQDAFNPTPYTLTVYDKDGTTVKETVNVGDGTNGTKKSGTVELTNLNNDAIKFKVEGLEGTDAKALITVELTMQALDPYIDQMSVVVYDPQTNVGTEENPQSLRLSQGFTASDFSVSGGEFDFYLPGVCSGHEVQITFEDLYSHYADESYTVTKDGFKGSADHFSRFNFVKSDHYNAFNNADGTFNNIYDNYSEAANPQKTRVKVGTVGTAPFKFNNAADVSAGRADYFIEYPFSLEAYAAAPNHGSFIEQKFTVSSTVQKKTSYVFTTDETAYNIAPTKATQHRVYAFYTMVVNVKSETYHPQVTFDKIYDQTLYDGSEGKPATDAFYRATVTAVDGNNNAGYATTDDIFKIIDAAVKNETASSGTVKEGEGTAERTIGTYTGKDKDLTSAKQLLCLDFSNLKGVFQITTEQHGSMDDYSNTNAANCLIFLPVNATAPNNNVAYKTPEGSFRAAHDIILTDKQPFYSPYNISVDAAQKIEYKRLLTTDKYGKPQNASLILPFAITLTEGKHTNADGTSFTIHTMRATEALAKDEDGSDYAFAPDLDNVSLTTANTPYLVKMDENGNSSADGVTFTVSQTGGTIIASTAMNESDYTFAGNTSKGSVDGTEYNLIMKGTYSGQKVPKTDNIFYFANNEFVNSADYKYNAPINVRPFRAYFAGNGTKNSAKLASFGLVFEDGIGTTGISTLDKNPDLMVIPGSGVITMTSTKEQNVRVHSTSGVMVNNTKLQAGETQTIQVPAGVYVINGVKIIVK